MFSTMLRHPLIGYTLFALVALAFDEYWRRWERAQLARAELNRRRLAGWRELTQQRQAEMLYRLNAALRRDLSAFASFARAIARVGDAFEAMAGTCRRAGPPLGGHAVMPDLSTARELPDGSIECDVIDSWSSDYGKRESR